MDDIAVPQHHRSGAHRVRRHPLLAGVLTLGAVAVASAALLWTLLSFDVLGVGDDLREAGGLTPVPSGEASGTPAAPSVEASPAPSGAAEPSPEPSPEATADRTLALDVLNGTGVSGMAASAAEALGEQGWTINRIANYDGDEIPTAVLYPEADAADAADATDATDGTDGTDGTVVATAEAVAADLGVGTVTPSADVEVLTVVLGPDYDF